MSDPRAQAQIRALTREIGTLKDELQREVKKRERLAVRAKECEELQAEAESRLRSLTYVNKCVSASTLTESTDMVKYIKIVSASFCSQVPPMPCSKLQQELASFKDKTQRCPPRTKANLESLRERLSSIEQSVETRSVEAQKHLQRVRVLVQDLAKVTSPLSAAVAAASPKLHQRGSSLQKLTAILRKLYLDAAVVVNKVIALIKHCLPLSYSLLWMVPRNLSSAKKKLLRAMQKKANLDQKCSN